MPKIQGTRSRQLLPVSVIWHPPLSGVIIYEDHERTSRRKTYVYSRGRGPRQVSSRKDSRASARCLRVIKKPPPATVETAGFLTDQAYWTRTRVSDSCSRPLIFVTAHPPTHILFFLCRRKPDVAGRNGNIYKREYRGYGPPRPSPLFYERGGATEEKIGMTKDYTEL